MADKRTHFGRAAEYHAMSQFLLRGWNVAVPVVDVGDDVFVIDDSDKSTWRLQVKSAEAERIPATQSGEPSSFKARFTLSRAQLRLAQPIELFYMLMVRADEAWRFLLIPRPDLLRLRDNHVDGKDARVVRGRRPLADEVATTDALAIDIVLVGAQASAWSGSLSAYVDVWPDALAPILGGPGSVGRPPSKQ